MSSETLKLAVTNYADNYGGINLIIDGRKASLSSINGYTRYTELQRIENIHSGPAIKADIESRGLTLEQYLVEQVNEDLERAERLHHPKVWINLKATCLCSDKGYYEREDAIWASAPRVSVGDSIEFEGSTYIIGNAPNKNFSLKRVDA